MSTTVTDINLTTIRAVAQFIADRFDPEQVILFGSYARGEEGEHSDVDLLVILRNDEIKQRRGNPIRRAIAERFVLPIDVVIRATKDVDKRRNDPYSLIHQALEEGVVLYERRAA